MKYILILLSCFLFLSVKGQEKKPLIKLVGDSTYISFVGYIDGKTQVGHDPKGNLVVKGDSAAAIKLLFKMIDAGAKREDDHWRMIAQYEKQLATIRRMLNDLKKTNTVKQ